MITARIIKLLVERESNIEDLSIKSRKRYIVDCRSVYYKLCKILLKKTLYYIGSIVNRNHASVLHGLKLFDDLYQTENFTASDIFLKVLNNLKEAEVEPKKIEELLTIHDVKQYYRIKYFEQVLQSHVVINNLNLKIYKIQSKEFLKRASKLTDNQLDELNERFDTYLKVKENINKSMNNQN